MGYCLGIVKVVHYFHLKMQQWYSRQWDPATTGTIKTPSFVNDLYNWINESIEVTWVPNTRGILAFQSLHQTNDDYHNHRNQPPPTRAPTAQQPPPKQPKL